MSNLTQNIVILIALWNAVVFAMYGIDKYKSIHNKWRISEFTLIICAYLMGGMGALFGMRFFHHKTLKLKFKLQIPFAVILNIIILVLALKYLNVVL